MFQRRRVSRYNALVLVLGLTAGAARGEGAPELQATPEAPPRSSRYTGTMVLADVGVIGLTIGGAVLAEGSGGGVGASAVVTLGFLAHVGTGAIVHHLHGNRRQVGLSLGRRVLLPLGAGLAVGLVVRALEGDCSGQEFCGLASVVVGLLGAGAGSLVALVWDWSVARVEPSLASAVVPFATADGERVVFGLGARF